jgi:pyruvate/2-oxoglutarate dehydrogenase complex dihydrolipoamide acyltransferase (E2) component
MKRIFATASLFTLMFALGACGDSAPPPKPAAPAAPPPEAAAPASKAPEAKAPEAPRLDPNKQLAQRVKQALEGDGKVHAAAVDVTATDGRVTLWGTAATAAERTRAGQIAAKVDGVSAVDNQLKVVKGS